jgi:hypothetical protein
LVIGLAPNHKLILFTVDGRQPGISEGLTTSEAAHLLLDDYGVTDAINLDGGGSFHLLASQQPQHNFPFAGCAPALPRGQALVITPSAGATPVGLRPASVASATFFQFL